MLIRSSNNGFDTVVVEILQARDLEHIRHLQPSGWSDIVNEFKFYVNSPFCFPSKTEIDNKIVGIGAAIEFENTAWLAHIIVDINHRRKGIGVSIVDELLKYMENRSIETYLLIATEMGLPIYKKTGFQVVSEYNYMNREKPSQTMKISDNITQYKKKYKDTVLKLDKEVTGENREKLLIEYMNYSYVYIEKKMVRGFYLPNLREGLIIADTDQAGIELLKLKLITQDKVIIPAQNTAGLTFLKQNGFVITDVRGIRMIRGKQIDWQPKKIFSRIGGNFG